MLLTLTILLLQLITLVKESVRFSWLLSRTELICRAPMEEATTDNTSVLLARLVAVLATEAEEEAQEAMVMAVEAAEAVEAEGIIPAPIMCPSMESDISDPFHSFTTDNGTSLAIMATNRCSVCKTVPMVSSLLPEEAEEVKCRDSGAFS